MVRNSIETKEVEVEERFCDLTGKRIDTSEFRNGRGNAFGFSFWLENDSKERTLIAQITLGLESGAALAYFSLRRQYGSHYAIPVSAALTAETLEEMRAHAVMTIVAMLDSAEQWVYEDRAVESDQSAEVAE